MIELWVFVAVLAALGKTVFYTYQKTLTDHYTTTELSYASSAMSLVVVIPPAVWVILQNGGVQGGISAWAIISVIGLLNIASFFIYMKALSMTDLGVASSLKRTNPIFVALAEPFILGISFNPMIVAACISAAVGGYLILLKGLNPMTPFLRLKETGPLLALATAFLYAGASLGSRFGATTVSPYTFGAAISLIMAIGFALMLFRQNNMFSLRKHANKQFIALGAFSGFKNMSVWIAYSLATATEVSTVTQLTIIFNVISGGLLLKEGEMKKRLVGAGLVFIGVVLVTLY